MTWRWAVNNCKSPIHLGTRNPCKLCCWCLTVKFIRLFWLHFRKSLTNQQSVLQVPTPQRPAPPPPTQSPSLPINSRQPRGQLKYRAAAGASGYPRRTSSKTRTRHPSADRVLDSSVLVLTRHPTAYQNTPGLVCIRGWCLIYCLPSRLTYKSGAGESKNIKVAWYDFRWKKLLFKNIFWEQILTDNTFAFAYAMDNAENNAK